MEKICETCNERLTKKRTANTAIYASQHETMKSLRAMATIKIITKIIKISLFIPITRKD